MNKLVEILKEKNRLYLEPEEIAKLDLSQEEKEAALFYHPNYRLYWDAVAAVEPPCGDSRPDPIAHPEFWTE